MKKFYSSFLLGIVAAVTAFAQPSLQWESTYNGSVAIDKGNAIALDDSGNVYVTGSSHGSNFESDYITIKYDLNGDTLWTKRYNGSANLEDVAVTIKVDGSNNVYVTGTSRGSGSGYDIVTIKYNSSGVQQWASVFNGGANDDDIGYNLFVDVSGNVYVVGSSYYLSGSTRTDGVLIKYNSSGIKLWDININESTISDEITNLVAINYLGNIVVADGYSTNNGGGFKILELNPSNGNLVQEYNQFFPFVTGTPDALVLDGVGNMYLTSTTAALNNKEVHTSKFSHGLSQASWDSWTYVTGSSQTIAGVDTKIDANLYLYVLSDFYNGINHTYYIKKYSPTGVTEWAMQYNASVGIDDIPVSFSLNNLSNPDIFVTGYTGTGNITVLKYDNDGNQLLAPPLIYDCGNNGIDVASAMLTDGCENIYITGYSNCAGTNEDIKTIKYSTAILPEITPIGSTNICPGGSVTLTAEACVGCTYLWSSGQTAQSILASPSITTDYTLTVFDEFGCAVITEPITIEVSPLPTITITGAVTICAGSSTMLSASGASSYSWSPATGLSDPNIANPVASPFATTSYTVTGAGDNGCSNTATVTVFINPLPNVTATGTNTICEGELTMLNAMGASSFSWSPATGLSNPNITSPIASPLTTTTYTVTGTDDNGCSNTAVVTIFVIPLPIIPPIAEITICEGDSIPLSVSGASSYSWTPITGLSNPNISNPNAFPTTTTTYTVTGTSNGCSNTEMVTITVNPVPDVTAIGTTDICLGSSTLLNAYGAISYSWSPETSLDNSNISNPTASPEVTTTYTVTGTLNGCSDTAMSTITVNPVPDVIATGEATICESESTILNAYGANTYSWSPTTGLSNPNISNPTASPATTTTYTVIGTLNDCFDTSTVTITIQAPPSLTGPISGTITPCMDSAYNYTVPEVVEADSYVWTLPDGWTWVPSGDSILATASATSGDISVVAINQCGESDPLTSSIIVTPTPQQPTITQNGNTLISDASIGNQWYHNGEAIPSATDQTYIAVESGSYYVVVTLNGCPSLPSTIVTGVELNSTDYSIDLFPNPTSTLLNIKGIGFKNDNYTIGLTNSLGQILKKIEYKSVNNSIEAQLDMTNLADGIYFLTIKSVKVNSSYMVYKL